MAIVIPLPLAGPVIDTHCHLDVHDRHLHADTAPEPDEMLAAAREVGVAKVVQIGCDAASARWSVDFARTRPDVIAGVAIHPNDAARLVERQGLDALDRAMAEIEELAADPVVRAVGETGLDYYRTSEAFRGVQQEAFRWHIRLARSLGKTLVIHDRDAHQDVIDILLDEGPPERVIFHCFSGDEQMALTCASHGWYMSFAGVVTYKANEALRQALARVPEHLLLVETDAPYLTPEPNRGKANGSYLMPDTVRRMAQVRGLDEARMCALLWGNAQAAFGAW
jgi:TatD DNase family protein